MKLSTNIIPDKKDSISPIADDNGFLIMKQFNDSYATAFELMKRIGENNSTTRISRRRHINIKSLDIEK